MALNPLYLAKHTGKEIDEAVEKVKTLETQVGKAYVKPTGGIPVSDLATTVQASLDLADTAIQTEALNEAITSAIEALDVADTAKDGEYVDSVSEVDGKVIVTRKALPAGYDDTALSGKVTTLEETVGNAESGLVKEVADNAAAIVAIKVPTKTSELTNDGDGAIEGAEGAFASVKYVQDTLKEATGGESAADVAAALNAHKIAADAHGIDVVKTDVAANKTAIEGLQTSVGSNTTAIDALQNSLADKADKTTLADYSTTEQMNTAISEEIAKVVANAPEDFDTLKEIADWIKNDTIGATQMQTDIATLKTQMAAIIDFFKKENGAYITNAEAELMFVKQSGTAE